MYRQGFVHPIYHFSPFLSLIIDSFGCANAFTELDLFIRTNGYVNVTSNHM